MFFKKKRGFYKKCAKETKRAGATATASSKVRYKETNCTGCISQEDFPSKHKLTYCIFIVFVVK